MIFDSWCRLVRLHNTYITVHISLYTLHNDKLMLPSMYRACTEQVTEHVKLMLSVSVNNIDALI